MKFIIAFSCLIAAASAIPAAVIAPAAVTYQSQKQYLAPVGVQTYTTVSKGAPIVSVASVASPVLAAPLAAPVYGGYSAPLATSVYGGVYGVGAPLAAAPYGLGLGLGYSKTLLGAPAVLAGPVLHK